MSFLGRLFGRSDPAPAAPPPNTVTIADDVAVALTAGGRPLGDAVDAALRLQLDARTRDPEPRVPFWLARDEDQRDIDDELRDRLERRRAAESGGAAEG